MGSDGAIGRAGGGCDTWGTHDTRRPPLGGWPEAACNDQDDVNALSLGGCRKSRAPSTSLACAGSGHGVAATHHVNHPLHEPALWPGLSKPPLSRSSLAAAAARKKWNQSNHVLAGRSVKHKQGSAVDFLARPHHHARASLLSFFCTALLGVLARIHPLDQSRHAQVITCTSTRLRLHLSPFILCLAN